MCERTMNKLMIAARRTDVNAVVNTEFCDGPVGGFSATLNSDGLKWVRNTSKMHIIFMYMALYIVTYLTLCS